MGQAKRKSLRADALDVQIVERVASAIRKLAQAASNHLGNDCYLHAMIGRELLKDFGIDAEIAAGFAAWRVGESDGSVIAHTPKERGYLPPGVDGFAYHAWLMCGLKIIDLTTYQLPKKAKDLDALDGGKTDVEWAPELLVASITEVRSFREVAQGHAGMFYYERNPKIERILAETSSLDAGDLQMARVILANPNAQVLGPSDMTRGLVG